MGEARSQQAHDRMAVRAEVAAQLGPLGMELDLERVERFAAAVASGRLSPAGNRARGRIDPLPESEIHSLDGLSPLEQTRLRARGEQALARGEIACAVLNGGMATRFGGRVKGVVEAFGGRSFLELKHAQLRRHGQLPLLVMNSFATHAATRDFLAEKSLSAGVLPFLQDVSLRLTPEGELFRDAARRLSLYAPGHGDFPEALRRSGLLDRLADEGVRAVLLSNVDNLGAEPDPLVIGHHLEHGRPISCELARARLGDVGGAPVLLDGRPQVLEGFCFPQGHDFRDNRFLATNSFVFALEALREPHRLTWFYVTKEVDGLPAVQMEHLVNELTAVLPTAYLETPRDGPRGRFFPVKTPEDLAALRADPALSSRFGALF